MNTNIKILIQIYRNEYKYIDMNTNKDINKTIKIVIIQKTGKES